MKTTRRTFLQAGSISAAAAIAGPPFTSLRVPESSGERKYRFVQIDVFTSRRLEGNALAVSPDARGLSDALFAFDGRIARENENGFLKIGFAGNGLHFGIIPCHTFSK